MRGTVTQDMQEGSADEYLYEILRSTRPGMIATISTLLESGFSVDQVITMIEEMGTGRVLMNMVTGAVHHMVAGQ